MSENPKKSGGELAKAGSGTIEKKVPPPEAKGSDTVLIHGVSRDGQTMAVLRARDERIEAGIMSPLKEGEPIEGEVVRLAPRPEFPLLCDVKVEVPAGTVNARGSRDSRQLGRPAQVATASYRDNWDAIWAKGSAKKSLPN